MSRLTALEEKETPLACKVVNYLEDLKMHLGAGCEKTSFGAEIDRLLSKLPEPDGKEQIKSFQSLWLGLQKTWWS